MSSTQTRELLNVRKIRRSAEAVTTGMPMWIYLGYCNPCDRPVRNEFAPENFGGRRMRDYEEICCPDCLGLSKGERLYAVETREECDGSCMWARGRVCSCGCGGVNHGLGWGRKLSESTELASALKKFRDHRELIERKRQEREAAKERKAQAVFSEWEDDNAEVISDILTWQKSHYILGDFARQINAKRKLSDKQIALAVRLVNQAIDREKREAEKAKNAKPAPVGPAVKIRGEIIKAEEVEGIHGFQWKMTVKCDGYAVYSTIPAKIVREMEFATRGEFGRNAVDAQRGYFRGKTVEFTAEISRSRNDESFAFAKRPKDMKLS